MYQYSKSGAQFPGKGSRWVVENGTIEFMGYDFPIVFRSNHDVPARKLILILPSHGG